MPPPAPASASFIEPGRRFADRYQVEAPLGTGGMGAVYRARDLSLGEPVALKLLAPHLCELPQAVLRFRQEVKLSRRVTHPNVVRVYDIGEHEGAIYFTMEYVEGDTLRALLRASRRLPLFEAARIGRALCDGIEAAHAVGIIHRDLKPSNIMLERGGRVLVTDFGIAQSVSEGPEGPEGLIGTPKYMAPEQRRCGTVDARTDIYSLGLVLHEMLTGALPDEGDHGVHLGLAEARKRGAELPEALDALLLRCLAFDPTARPATAEEVRERLTAAVSAAVGRDAPSSGAPGSGEIEGPTLHLAPPARPDRMPSLDTIGERALAVLPFRWLGPPNLAHLGDTIAGELFDALSRMHGVRVLGGNALEPFRQSRDPVAIGRALAVLAVLDGAVQSANGRVRTSVRLLDAENGKQIWTETHEGTLADLFAFQASIARRVAEGLRIELSTLSYRGHVPDEAIEHYLMARRDVRTASYQAMCWAVAGFGQCLELAPHFLPAIAGHALASARGWFLDHGLDAEHRWEAEATASVERALAQAPDLAETHLAAAMLAVQNSEFHAVARSLARALHIAPTCAEAHEYLGMLECEAGRLEEGLARLALAVELDPSRFIPHTFTARAHALAGRFEQAGAVLDDLERRMVPPSIGAALLRVRSFAWSGASGPPPRPELPVELRDSPRAEVVTLYWRTLTGRLQEGELERLARRISNGMQSARSFALVSQLLVEMWMVCGRQEAALDQLARSAAVGLIDIDWLERCQLLAPLRRTAVFGEIRRKVRARAAAIWA